MAKLLLIHGFEGSSEGNWFPWMQREMQARGYEVFAPDLPFSAHPNEEQVIPFLENATKDFTSADCIIGHSLGAYWACRLAEMKRFNSIILVAPATGNLPFDRLRKEFPDADIDALENTVRKSVDVNAVCAEKKVVFFSKDDPFVPSTDIELFNNSWRRYLLDARGHMQQKECMEVLMELDPSLRIFTRQEIQTILDEVHKGKVLESRLEKQNTQTNMYFVQTKQGAFYIADALREDMSEEFILSLREVVGSEYVYLRRVHRWDRFFYIFEKQK